MHLFGSDYNKGGSQQYFFLKNKFQVAARRPTHMEENPVIKAIIQFKILLKYHFSTVALHSSQCRAIRTGPEFLYPHTSINVKGPHRELTYSET